MKSISTQKSLNNLLSGKLKSAERKLRDKTILWMKLHPGENIYPACFYCKFGSNLLKNKVCRRKSQSMNIQIGSTKYSFSTCSKWRGQNER